MNTDILPVGTQNGHSRCLLCGHENPLSLGLCFRPIDKGSILAEFRPIPVLQGYDGVMHGGIVAALLDAAMTHCLFHRGNPGNDRRFTCQVQEISAD